MDTLSNSSTGIVTAIKSYPKTMERPVPVGLDQEMPNPGLPRANKAISTENQKVSSCLPGPAGPQQYTLCERLLQAKQQPQFKQASTSSTADGL
jgi:hypothetical protein